jgi:hypothetical protein
MSVHVRACIVWLSVIGFTCLLSVVSLMFHVSTSVSLHSVAVCDWVHMLTVCGIINVSCQYICELAVWLSVIGLTCLLSVVSLMFHVSTSVSLHSVAVCDWTHMPTVCGIVNVSCPHCV